MTTIDARTLFERKAVLINTEIDKTGFGKYQWCIWMLCGLGYFVDLAWAQGVGLMATAVFQDMGVSAGKQGLIFTCSNAGLAIGAFGFGILTDIIGRKWAFQITCLITSIFGMLLAASKYNYGAICGVYFLSCIGLGGNVPIDATIALEFLPQNRRYLVALLGMWQPIGVVVASAIAYGTAAKYRCDVKLPACTAVSPGQACCTVSSNMGWRYMVIIIGCMTLTIFFARYFVFRFYESPKFLLSKGREQDAIDVLHKIAKFNGADAPSLSVDDFRRIEHEFRTETRTHSTPRKTKGVVVKITRQLSSLRGLFLSRLQCFSFVLLGIAYMGNYWSFNLAGYFLPIVLLNNNVDSGADNVRDTYRQYVYIYLPGILGAIVALFSIQMPLLGRKWSLVVSAALQGLSMAMYTQVKNTAGYVGLNALEYIMQSYFNAVLYSASPEMFDTNYRASASGMLSCLGRIAGIVAPFAGQKYIAEGRSGVLWLGAGGIWVSALLLCFLPIEMRNRQMY
ncbi:major facilitator superfamily domain-containing protein [Aspergillus floccosus]